MDRQLAAALDRWLTTDPREECCTEDDPCEEHDEEAE